MIALALRSFLTLLVVLDPIGLVPVYLGLASRHPTSDRDRIARRAVIVAGLVLLLFGAGGGWLLVHLGITLDAFRVAGGILLFKIAVDMVFAQFERETAEERSEAHSRDDISVFPLAIPLIAGPGGLASIMILAGEAHGVRWGSLIVLVVALLVLGLVFVALHLSGRIARVLGQTGINVVTRVMGLLLAALAAQYVADGVLGLLRS
jgi:multiple antibiotic resistance protein